MNKVNKLDYKNWLNLSNSYNLYNNIIDNKLTIKQELFCRTYTLSIEYFGNWTQSYAIAYNIDKNKNWWQKTAKVNASRLLTNANLLKRINYLLSLKINDAFVDKNLAFLIMQKADLRVCLNAIKEYNRLKWRIASRASKSYKKETYSESKIALFEKTLERIRKSEINS